MFLLLNYYFIVFIIDLFLFFINIFFINSVKFSNFNFHYIFGNLIIMNFNESNSNNSLLITTNTWSFNNSNTNEKKSYFFIKLKHFEKYFNSHYVANFNEINFHYYYNFINLNLLWTKIIHFLFFNDLNWYKSNYFMIIAWYWNFNLKLI